MGVLDQFKLDGRVAVVTGAGKGIGRGIALALAEAGADVALAARSAEDLETVAAEVRERGRRAIVVPTDVTQMEMLENLAGRTKAELGAVDIWVNNAGGLPDGIPRYLTRTSEAQFSAQIDLNLKAVWAGCVVAAGAMGEDGGVIVNISSRAGKDMAPNLKNGPYAASKSAVNSLTATFSRELAPRIRVNAVGPGPIPTENFTASVRMDTPERAEEVRRSMNIALQRFGAPEDIGAAVVYLASPASSWVTGQVIYVAGG